MQCVTHNLLPETEKILLHIALIKARIDIAISLLLLLAVYTIFITVEWQVFM